jgi:hypothetical protein
VGVNIDSNIGRKFIAVDQGRITRFISLQPKVVHHPFIILITRVNYHGRSELFWDLPEAVSCLGFASDESPVVGFDPQYYDPGIESRNFTVNHCE